MLTDDYNKICKDIIEQTMKSIKTSNIKKYPDINKGDVRNGDITYKTAAADKFPITLVNTPAGTGKSNLIKDRVFALIGQRVPPKKIMILNMNISKVKQMKNELPQNIQIYTFSQFAHNIFQENFPNMFALSDNTSIRNKLMLSVTGQNDVENKLIQRLNMTDPQEKITMLTLLINQYPEEILSILKTIAKTSYTMETLLCQNMMYSLEKDPYKVDSIIINGVHNMPVPILCCVLEYANKYKTNLFITGTNDETIYEFNMACKNTMRILSSWQSRDISIIRLSQSKINPAINNVIEMKRANDLPGIKTKYINSQKQSIETAIQTALSAKTTDFISDKLSNKEQILILARSNQEIKTIKSIMESEYDLKNHKIIDLTEIQIPKTTYGTILAKYNRYLTNKYKNGITSMQLKYELYEIYKKEIKNTNLKHQITIYTNDKSNISDFVDKIFSFLKDTNQPYDTRFIINGVIEYESKSRQKTMQKMENMNPPDFKSADLIFATIHSAIDLRSNNTIVIFNNLNEEQNANLYHVALSRANKSEYIVFIDNPKFPNKHYKYLTNYISDEK